MSIGVFILSIIFAGIEALASWLMLSFMPVATIFAGVPLWLITAIVFALGMLLSFVLILLVGGSQITDRAADFVRDHLGRALALMLASVILIFGLASGAEVLYQLGPIQFQGRASSKADICFIVDFSSSMSWGLDGNTEPAPGEPVRDEELKKAFAEAINALDDDQRVSIVRYESTAEVICDWKQLSSNTRSEVIAAVNAQDSSGGTDFASAFNAATPLINQAITTGRTPVAIFLSDGEDPGFGGLAAEAPDFFASGVKVYTIGFGEESGFDKLQEIAAESGGEMLSAGSNVGDISATLLQATTQASNVVNDSLIPDTLLTSRYSGRSAIINPMVLRILLLFILSFVFKLIVNICIGNNDSSVGVHILTAFIIALLGSLAVEFGYMLGLPLLAVESVYWLLLMCQIVITNR